MPPKLSNAELQLKVVQRNYESISRMMHSKQQECEKVSQRVSSHLVVKLDLNTSSAVQLELELEGIKHQLHDAAEMRQQAVDRADGAEGQIKVSCCSRALLLSPAELQRVKYNAGLAGPGDQAAR